MWGINGDHELMGSIATPFSCCLKEPSWTFPKIHTKFYDTWVFSYHKYLHLQVGLDALSSIPQSSVTIILASLTMTWTARHVLLPHDPILWTAVGSMPSQQFLSSCDMCVHICVCMCVCKWGWRIENIKAFLLFDTLYWITYRKNAHNIKCRFL